jgi:hypothetical protein
MRAIVADCAGYGVLTDKDGVGHQLTPEAWTQADVRDSVTATFGVVTVRYRDDGRTVEVAVGHTYHIEAPVNRDVIDVRSATYAAEEIIAALSGPGADEERIYRALELAPHDHSRGPWINQLRFIFGEHTQRHLSDELADQLHADELARVNALLPGLLH